MKKGSLSEYFVGIAIKRLSAVEVQPDVSNQHEFDGVRRLGEILGAPIPRRKFRATFLYLSDDEPEPLQDECDVTWYDAREKHPTRSEARLYFPRTVVTDNATEGDLLVIARKPDDSLLIIVAESGSTSENQLLWLMGEADLGHPGFSIKSEIESDQLRLDFISRIILENLGVEATGVDGNLLDQMLEKFGGRFPLTAELSEFVRDSLNLNPMEDADGALVAWYEREYILFKTLEEHFLSERITAGFPTVIEFLDLSLSVHQRRRSRAGSALQNHLTPIFRAHGIRFDPQGLTEGHHRPDFLFPGTLEYQDTEYPIGKLYMLAAKTSCKERWKQILTEAARISKKHLCTFETGISENQTNQMISFGVQLVVPTKFQPTYSVQQQGWLMNVKQFIDTIKASQK